MDGRYENVAIDIFLAEPIVQWWMEASDPQRCKHAYRFELKFRDASDVEILEAAFYYLNVRYPENYRNRSLSVGDVVTLNDDRSYLCAPLGWEKLSRTLRRSDAEPCSPAKTAISPKENRFDAS